MTDPFYKGAAWARARSGALRRAGWRCAWCGADVRAPGRARVDHIQTRKAAPERELDATNLRVLCATCDNRRHAEKGGRVVQQFNADGTPRDPRHHWNRSR